MSEYVVLLALIKVLVRFSLCHNDYETGISGELFYCSFISMTSIENYSLHEDALHNPDPKPLRGNNIVSYYRSNLEQKPALLVGTTDLYLNQQ